MNELADAVARVPGRAAFLVIVLAVAVPVWVREFRLDQKWKGRAE